MARRNYGPKGCLIVVLSVLLIAIAAELVMQQITTSYGPDAAQLQARTLELLRARLGADREIGIESVHLRRDRFTVVPRRWLIQGTVGAPVGSSESVSAYSAVVRTVCDDLDDAECWSLKDLTIIGEIE